MRLNSSCSRPDFCSRRSIWRLPSASSRFSTRAAFTSTNCITQLPTLNDDQVLLSELGIVDLTLTASLVVIVFLSGYTNFVAPVASRKDDGRPHWIAEIDFSELKLKLMASIVAISGIKLLEAFMNIAHEPDRDLYWLVGIHLTFVVSTIVLALAERFGTPHTPLRRRLGGRLSGAISPGPRFGTRAATLRAAAAASACPDGDAAPHP